MARICYACKKKTKYGNAVSHSNRKSRRTWKANLVYIRANINGSIKKIRLCTRCLKSNKIQKVISSREKTIA